MSARDRTKEREDPKNRLLPRQLPLSGGNDSQSAAFRVRRRTRYNDYIFIYYYYYYYYWPPPFARGSDRIVFSVYTYFPCIIILYFVYVQPSCRNVSTARGVSTAAHTNTLRTSVFWYVGEKREKKNHRAEVNLLYCTSKNACGFLGTPRLILYVCAFVCVVAASVVVYTVVVFVAHALVSSPRDVTGSGCQRGK